MRHAQGFTLIELITVMVLVGILGGATYFRLPARQIDLATEAKKVASAIQYTQLLSTTHWARYRINFSSTGYRITQLDGITAVVDPGNLATQETLVAGVSLTTTNTFLVFNSLGVPYRDALSPGAPLAANAVISFTAQGQTRQITVSPETGNVQVNAV